MIRQKMYLDIDGVLLTKDKKRPSHLVLFLDFILSNYDCYWLTTHCRTGENKVIPYLTNFYSKELINKIAVVKPTNWTDKKTEAIDYHSSFIWLDDYPFEAERVDLIKNNCLESLMVVDLNMKDELVTIMNELKAHK